jgi:hypothetical protein
VGHGASLIAAPAFGPLAPAAKADLVSDVDGGLNPHLSGAGSKIAAKFGRDDAAPSLLTEAIHSEALT